MEQTENKLTKKLKEQQSSLEAEVQMDSVLAASNQLLLGAGDKDVQILESLGLDHIHKYQREINSDIVRTKKAKEIYERDSFTGKQVKTLCNQYYLKVLPADLYMGPLTAELPRMVAEFCEKNQIDINYGTKDSFFILAPINQFNTTKNVPIQKIPVNQDPILFYRPEEKGTSSHNTHRKVNEDDVLIQVYNWGSDFHESRKFMYLFNSTKLSSDDISPLAITTIASIIMLLAFVSAFLPFIILTLSLFALGVLFFIANAVSEPYIDKLWNDSRV